MVQFHNPKQWKEENKVKHRKFKETKILIQSLNETLHIFRAFKTNKEYRLASRWSKC